MNVRKLIDKLTAIAEEITATNGVDGYACVVEFRTTRFDEIIGENVSDHRRLVEAGYDPTPGSDSYLRVFLRDFVTHKPDPTGLAKEHGRIRKGMLMRGETVFGNTRLPDDHAEPLA